MRKMLIGVSLIALTLTTGCFASKEKNLVCTTNVSGIKIEFNIKFKGNIVKNMDFSYDMDLSSYSESQIDLVKAKDFCPTIKQSMPDYSFAFKDCNQKLENKHLIVASEIDVDKIANSTKDKMGSPTKTKEALEKTGYSCSFK